MSTPAEQFWSSKASRSTIEGGEQAVFGKLLHSHELSGKANVIVSVVLTLNDETAPQHRDTLITLKTRLKGSKTGCKVYVLVASFPESTLLSTPVWRKDSGKHHFLCKAFGHLLQITYSGSWKNDAEFVVEEKTELPVLLKHLQPANHGDAVDDFYENQWRQSIIGKPRYSYKHFSVKGARPPFSTMSGRLVLPRDQIMTPCPHWVWTDDWHIDTSLGEPEGWIYVDHWHASQCAAPETTKFRVRRWIRTRHLNKVADSDAQDLEPERTDNQLFSDLKQSLPPFLRELLREVRASPGDFDFSSLAGIPSPKLRRALKRKVVA